MITTGVTGREWRASITPWGAVRPWDGSAPLDWYVAADDRWHVPAREAAVRQVRLAETAVVETRVRIPRGDAVHRVYSVADAGGMTVVEVENESTMPIAVAFDRRDVRTDRPIGDVPIEGIDLPPGSFVLPVGHRATVRIALAHDGSGAGPLPRSLPSAARVAGGWTTVVGAASRFELPDGGALTAAAQQCVAERCELLLGAVPRADDDPSGFAIALGELVRLGERPDPWLPELAAAVAAIAPERGWDGDVALGAAAPVLVAAGEDRAARDLARIVAGRRRSSRPSAPPEGARIVPWVETQLAADGALLPEGMPPEWLGANFEVHGVPVAASTTVSFAVRWHGERPAVLWELDGEPVELTAPVVDPAWRANERAGEALWAAPSGPRRPSDEPDGASFS
jgi:hypothetical protein